jgi:citrate synthase
MEGIVRAGYEKFKVDYHQVMTALTAQEVAARLGVKIDTVYAYVSRGVLTSHRRDDSRLSRFDSDEVEGLARRGRPRRGSRPAALDVIVETELATIVDQRVLYRGRDAARIARTETFEQAAEWLWTGRDAPFEPWQAYEMSMPELENPRDRIRAGVVIAAADEPFRADLSPAAVTSTARALIATMVSAVPARPDARAARLILDGERAPLRGSIAGRLWGRLGLTRATPGLVQTLNAALVLLCDHELAPSTLAARVAASVRADPFAVVLAGLGPVAGSLHGGASALAHEMLADARTRTPRAALATAVERHGHLPGFGHRLYLDGDPRAKLLLEMLAAASPGTPGLDAARAVVRAARQHARAEPNVDFALAALSTIARMPPTAGETIFTIARTAGWIAHALEEYSEQPLRFRARAIRRASSAVV